jgi:hypothetical protein
MKIVKVCSFILIVILGLNTIGCSVPLKDAHVADCGPWLFGIAKSSSEYKHFPPVVSVDTYKATCLKTSYAQGFDQFDPVEDERFSYRSEEVGVQRKPTRAGNFFDKTSGDDTKKAADDVHMNIAEMPRFSLSSTSHHFEFATQLNWELAASPSPLYQAFAINRTHKAALFISVHDVNPFLIWSDSRDSMYIRMRETLVYADVTKVKELKLNGLDAFQIEYRGRDKDDAPLHFLSTQIRLGNKLIYLTSWCFENDYAKNENEFHLIASSLVAKQKLFSW